MTTRTSRLQPRTGSRTPIKGVSHGRVTNHATTRIDTKRVTLTLREGRKECEREKEREGETITSAAVAYNRAGRYERDTFRSRGRVKALTWPLMRVSICVEKVDGLKRIARTHVASYRVASRRVTLHFAYTIKEFERVRAIHIDRTSSSPMRRPVLRLAAAVDLIPNSVTRSFGRSLVRAIKRVYC